MGPGHVVWIILAGVVGILIGGVATIVVERVLARSKLDRARMTAAQVMEEAERQATEIELAAEKEALRTRNQAEQENQRKLQELRREDERLQTRREALDKRMDRLEERERRLNQRQSRLDRMRSQIEELHEKQKAELQRIANLSEEEAKELLLQEVESQVRDDMAHVIREVEAKAREEAEQKAREIITMAIQRYAGVIVDDTPEAVILSSFDPVRREIARVAVSKLVSDGRIHPARIEKMIAKATQEVNAIVREEGEQAVLDVGLPGLHPEVVKLLGQLKYRTSYGQNVLLHSIETAHLAGMMAAELGADVTLAKEGGLLHDIGKAVDHEVEGPHATIGADLARRYGRSARVVDCVAAHHSEAEPHCLEAVLVEAADAISGARAGARRESLESYLKRVKGLEDIANSFTGVSQSYAIQAGREVRIIVRPDELDDLAAIQLSKDVARRVEESLQYPGQIKVTVIRETRAIDYAK